MNGGYRWVAHQQAVEALLRFSPAVRRQVIAQLDHLADDPFQEGEAQGQDETGRNLSLKIAGPFIITSWSDHAAKEVRILAIERV